MTGTEAGLVRAIGVRDLTASIVNVTIGAGIFVLPAVVAGGLGAAAPIAYIVCAGLMALIVCCFAAAGSRVLLTGGPYAYVEIAFGPFAAFLAGMLYSLMAAFASASVASAFAGSIGAVWAPLGGPVARAGLLALLFATVAAANVRGVTVGARLVTIVTIAKLAPLALFIAAGIWSVRGEYLVWSPMPKAAAVGHTALVLIFAFVGVEIALVPSGEVRDPHRTVPRAVFTALGITTTVYLLIQTVAQGLLGPSMARFASAPLAEAASLVLGAGGRALVLTAAVVSMYGFVCGDMLASPRALFAYGRDGALPSVLAYVDPRFHTPSIAIVLHAIIVAALAISSSFTQLAIVANVAALTLYLMCIAASYELQRRDVRANGTPFLMPGGPAVAVLAAAVIVWLLTHATRREFVVEGLVLAVASLYYFIRRRGGQV